MPKCKLTDKFLNKLQPGLKDAIWWDEAQPGLGVKVTRKGTKSFLVQYRHQGRLRWFHIDRYPAVKLSSARQIAEQVRARAALGQDPHGDKLAARAGDTFGDLAKAYFDQAGEGHRSVKQYQGHWTRYIKPHVGARKAGSLRRQDFIDIKNRLVSAGHSGTVGPVLAVASAIISYGINEKGLDLTENPAHGVKHRHKRAERRALEDDEIKALWTALPELSWPWGDILRVMMFTGQRHDEVRNLRAEYIKDDWWTQPANKAGRIHRVYLTKTVRDIIANQPSSQTGLVFPNSNGGAYRKFDHATVGKVREATGIADFVPHMLRHTAVTKLSQLGVVAEHRSRVVNHAEGGITAKYGHYDFDKERKAALTKLDRHLRQDVLSLDRADKVVALR